MKTTNDVATATAGKLLLTLDEAAATLNMSSSELRRITDEGGIAVVRRGRKLVRYSVWAIEAWIKSVEAKGTEVK